MEQKLPSLGFLLHDASRALRKTFEARAGSFGLSSAQWRLLVNVIRLKQSSQARLADLLEIEPISVSRLIDRMAAGGWVAREPDPEDRRVKIVVPTDQAQKAFAEVAAMASTVYDEALAGLSSAERATLVAGLTAIITNLSAGELGQCPASTEARP